MRVIISDYWRQRALERGSQRQAAADARDLKNYGDTAAGEAEHQIGALGEIATAKILNRPWKPQIGKLDGVDVDGVAEARTRRATPQWPFPDLALRPHDKLDKPYVLVYIDECDNIDVIGWLYGHEMKERQERLDLPAKKGVYYIPGPYRSVESLIEQFAAPHATSA